MRHRMCTELTGACHVLRPGIDQLHSENVMSKSIVVEAGAAADLRPAPIPPDWILNGTPEARSKELARSDDRTSHSMVWECTAGRFNWHYNKEETSVVISGEAFITNGQGEERRLGPGDVVFFPAGTSCTWCVPTRSEEHTSELQSRLHLVCRLLLEKKKHDQCLRSRRLWPYS